MPCGVVPWVDKEQSREGTKSKPSSKMQPKYHSPIATKYNHYKSKIQLVLGLTKHTTGKGVKWVHWPAIDYLGVGQRQQPASHCRLGIPQPLLHLEEFTILASISESTFLNSLGLLCIEVDLPVFRYSWQCLSSVGFSYGSWYLSSPPTTPR